MVGRAWVLLKEVLVVKKEMPRLSWNKASQGIGFGLFFCGAGLVVWSKRVPVNIFKLCNGLKPWADFVKAWLNIPPLSGSLSN